MAVINITISEARRLRAALWEAFPMADKQRRGGYDAKTKAEAIIAWAAEEKDDFNTAVVESILKQEKDRPGSATRAQEQALDNIISGFRIEVGEWV